jgi:acyl dehydratase
VVEEFATMPLNRDFMGRSHTSASSYEVGREKLREFAAAIGYTHLVFQSKEVARQMGYQDVIAPPTFAIVVSAGSAEPLVFDPALGLDYAVVVHGEQRFEHRRPIVAGDILTTTATITRIEDTGRNELLETQTQIKDADDQLVCVCTNVIISRGTAGAGAA